MSVVTGKLMVVHLTELTSDPLVSVLSSDVDLWLSGLVVSEPVDDIYWARDHHTAPASWITARGVEHLTVLISTCAKSHNNVCQIYGSRDKSTTRSTNVIGLDPSRGPLGGFAILLRDAERKHLGDVRRIDYPFDNYDSFSALAAAEMSWSWVTGGVLPREVNLRARRA